MPALLARDICATMKAAEAAGAKFSVVQVVSAKDVAYRISGDRLRLRRAGEF